MWQLPPCQYRQCCQFNRGLLYYAWLHDSPLTFLFTCAGWNMNPEDAAAFAAAQQMAAAEAAREAPGAGPGAGIDADLNG
jgi:hypothetical protein